jgi:ANTAR domain
VYVPTRRRVWKLVSVQAPSRRGRASVAGVCAAATSVDVSGAWVTAGDGLTEQLGVSTTEAFARLRAYAYAQDRRLSDIAHDIVTRRLRPDPDPREME